jgi:hypothetical protein
VSRSNSTKQVYKFLWRLGIDFEEPYCSS